MGRGFGNIVYLILTILVIVGVINLIGFLLPYILIVIAVLWLYRLIKGKKNSKKERYTMNDYRYDNYRSNEMQRDEDGDVVDVDYEEIDK